MESLLKSNGRIAVFVRFLCSSAGTAIIDIVLFQIFCFAFNGIWPALSVYIATALARIIAATINYIINRKLVFQSDVNVAKSGTEFAVLTVIKTVISAVAVDALTRRFPNAFFGWAVGFKIIVDIALFFVNYICQKMIIFMKKA